MKESPKKQKNQSFVDFMIVLAITFTGMILFSVIDAYEKFHEITRQLEDWNFDDLLLGAYVFSSCMIWYSYRRWKETKQEMKKRIQAEKERRGTEVRKTESLKIMAGSIAHNFNNLLMVIMGSLDMASSILSPDSEVKKNIERAENASREAARLSKLMLTYVGQNFTQFQTVKIELYYKDIEDFLSKSIPVNISLVKDLSAELPETWCSPAQIKQTIENIVINAVEAIGDNKGTITITSGLMACDCDFFAHSAINDGQPEGNYIYFDVSDTGCGIKKELISEIFDPYFTTKFIGRGLGLAAVYGIVRAHKGTIVVESEPGYGTSVRLFFPVYAKEPGCNK